MRGGECSCALAVERGMSELDDSYPRFRVVLYIVNPLAEHRVPIAVVVRTPDGSVQSLSLPEISIGYFGGNERAYAHVQALETHVQHIEDFHELPPGLGPHFVYGRIQGIPTTDWGPWVAGVLSPASTRPVVPDAAMDRLTEGWTDRSVPFSPFGEPEGHVDEPSYDDDALWAVTRDGADPLSTTTATVVYGYNDGDRGRIAMHFASDDDAGWCDDGSYDELLWVRRCKPDPEETGAGVRVRVSVVRPAARKDLTRS